MSGCWCLTNGYLLLQVRPSVTYMISEPCTCCHATGRVEALETSFSKIEHEICRLLVSKIISVPLFSLFLFFLFYLFFFFWILCGRALCLEFCDIYSIPCLFVYLLLPWDWLGIVWERPYQDDVTTRIIKRKIIWEEGWIVFLCNLSFK